MKWAKPKNALVLPGEAPQSVSFTGRSWQAPSGVTVDFVIDPVTAKVSVDARPRARARVCVCVCVCGVAACAHGGFAQ